MKALANEIAKNVVLAGVGSMTIIDSENVVDDDLGSQFFISEQHIGMNVQISVNSCSFHSTNLYVSEQKQQHHRFESSIRESYSMSTPST